MAFTDTSFLIGVPLLWILFVLLPPRRRWWLLLPASYAFYMVHMPWYGLLLLGSTLVDYWIGRGLGSLSAPRLRRTLLLLSLVVNLGVLTTFKYAGFFAETLGHLTPQAFTTGTWIEHLLLPVGISFYTFQSMSYSLDVYHGRVAPTRHFGHFASYISFFPQLVAGPIERANRMLPCFAAPTLPTRRRLVEGMHWLLGGFFLKLVMADNVAPLVNAVFAEPERFTSLGLWAAANLFAVQIYGDFAGYSLIAIGTARLFGFNLTQNFKRPWLAIGAADYWHRWHISLSTWFRDYVFVPLGGSRNGPLVLVWATSVTFLLSGLWHGAAWTFIAWGGVHALLYLLAVATPRRSVKPSPVGRLLRTLAFSQILATTWVLFRSPSIEAAIGFLIRMLSTEPLYDLRNVLSGAGAASDPMSTVPSFLLRHPATLYGIAAAILVLGYEVWQECGRRTQRRRSQPQPQGPSGLWRLPRVLRWVLYYAGVASILIFGNFGGEPFIYFQF